MRRHPNIISQTLLAVSTLFAVAAPSYGQDEIVEDPDFLMALNLEELMDVEVYTVGRKQERQFESAAAVYVLTTEEISRLPAQTLVDMLRYVPGVNVAQVNSHKYAVSVRGFNDIYSNKLLVMKDGRSLYTPTFSGVYWNELDFMLEDLARIEVVRGPGGAAWGANAVNGVINIISKPSWDTQGTLVTGGYGSELEGLGAIRHGGVITEDKAWYRVFLKYANHDSFHSTQPIGANDDWYSLRGGGRMDWKVSEQSTFTLDLEGHHQHAEDSLLVQYPPLALPQWVKQEDRYSGGTLSGRLEREVSKGERLLLQADLDYRERKNSELAAVERTTATLKYQQSRVLGGGHELLWGAEFIHSRDELESTPQVQFDPSDRDINIISAFLQDEVPLGSEDWRLVGGLKVEHNPFTDFEFMPSVRLKYTPKENLFYWAAVSRAVRTPSRAETDAVIRLASGMPGVVTELLGQEDFDSEELTAFEVGTRFKPRSNMSVDLTAFYHVYDDLRSLGMPTIVPSGGPPPTYILVSGLLENETEGASYGFEAAVDVQPTDRWNLRTSFSALDVKLQTGGDPSEVANEENSSPHYQASLLSSFALGRDWDLSVGLRYVGEFGVGVNSVDGYLTADSKLTWKPVDRFRISLAGRNLLNPHRREAFNPAIPFQIMEVERSVFLQGTYEF